MARNTYPRKLGWLIAALLILSAYAKGAERRGADIHFRGPVFAIGLDASGQTQSMTLQVNRSQIEVQVNSWTEVIAGRGFRITPSQVVLSSFLEVDGFFTSNGRIVARRIHVEAPTSLELEGVVEWAEGGMVRISGVDLLFDAEAAVHYTVADAAGTAPKAGDQVRLQAQYREGLWVCTHAEVGPRTVESEPLRLSGRLVKLENQMLSVDVGIPGVAALVAFDQGTQFTGTPRVGLELEVEGRFLPGTALIKANRIAVDVNDNGNVYDDADNLMPPVAAVALRGAISNLRRTGNRVEFLITETRVVVDARTRIFSAGQPVEPSILADGLPVHVTGHRDAGGFVVAGEIVVLQPVPPTAPTPGVSRVEREGVIESVLRTPGGSVVHFRLGQDRVFVNPETEIAGPGGPTSSRALDKGLEVKVEGIWRNDGSILAHKIEIKD